MTGGGAETTHSQPSREKPGEAASGHSSQVRRIQKCKSIIQRPSPVRKVSPAAMEPTLLPSARVFRWPGRIATQQAPSPHPQIPGFKISPLDQIHHWKQLGDAAAFPGSCHVGRGFKGRAEGGDRSLVAQVEFGQGAFRNSRSGHKEREIPTRFLHRRLADNPKLTSKHQAGADAGRMPRNTRDNYMG